MTQAIKIQQMDMFPKSTQKYGVKLGAILRDAGMRRAADNSNDDLEAARQIAAHIGKKHGYCCADDVYMVMQRLLGIETLGPAAGSIFRTDEWEWKGDWKRSERVSNHARMIRVWRYKGFQIDNND